MTDIDQLRFPIGKFKYPENIDSTQITEWIASIENFPKEIKAEVMDLSEDALGWQYRPDGWSIRQLVHHCADSHMNSQMRFRLALTEDTPTIKPYLEAKWANLPDIAGPIAWSLELLTGLHARWAMLLNNLTEDDLAKVYFHPDQKRNIRLDSTIALYAWHGKHHLAHIKLAKMNRGKVNE